MIIFAVLTNSLIPFILLLDSSLHNILYGFEFLLWYACAFVFLEMSKYIYHCRLYVLHLNSFKCFKVCVILTMCNVIYLNMLKTFILHKYCQRITFVFTVALRLMFGCFCFSVKEVVCLFFL